MLFDIRIRAPAHPYWIISITKADFRFYRAKAQRIIKNLFIDAAKLLFVNYIVKLGYTAQPDSFALENRVQGT